METHFGRDGSVVGKMIRANEGNFRTISPGDLGDLRVIGGNHDAIDRPGRLGGLDGVSNQRFASQGQNIFSRKAFGSSTGGNDCQGIHC